MTHTPTPTLTADQLVEAQETAAELRTLARDILSDAAGEAPDTVERPLDPAVWAALEETGH